MSKFEKLVEIVATLRTPGTGCPWDLKQTRETLVPNIIEELYEVIEAIENKDDNSLKEELGDLLLHIVFQAQISKEQGLWSIDDVLDEIINQLIRSHPYAFGDLSI